MKRNRVRTDEAMQLHQSFKTFSDAKRLVIASLLSALAAILQAMGHVLPGVGYFISPFATLPIVICTLISIIFGLHSYLLTIILLVILQPSESFIFIFTTGLLGVGLGGAYLWFRQRINRILLPSLLLFAGICCLLYIFQFPILGSFASTSPSWKAVVIIYLFSFGYSWLWVEFSQIIFIKLLPFVEKKSANNQDELHG